MTLSDTFVRPETAGIVRTLVGGEVVVERLWQVRLRLLTKDDL